MGGPRHPRTPEGTPVLNRATEWLQAAPNHVRTLLSYVHASTTKITSNARLLDRTNLNGRGKAMVLAGVAIIATGFAGAISTAVYAAAHHPAKQASVASASDDKRAVNERADR